MPPLASLQSSTCPDTPSTSSASSADGPSQATTSDVVSPLAALKRRASSAFESTEDISSRKKIKEHLDDTNMTISTTGPVVDGQALADELEQELQCGCCAALVYRPVLVSPCQHFFCGSCVVLWIRNGGTNCPACRGVSTSVVPSRVIQLMADILSRAAPSRARTVQERMQADEVYKAGVSLRIPTPRQPSPEPTIQTNNNYVHPCPHCMAANQWGWRCPQPIGDPDADLENAWHADDGTPPGHAYCGNCESILALQAPTTTKCDFCQVSFCGVGIPGRCVAAPLTSQHPHGLSDLADLIQCGEIYDCFDHNSVEVDIMLDYLTAQNFTPRHIYREIVGMILRSPRQFQPLFDLELFMDVHAVSGGVDSDPTAPRQRICRVCATEILLWGLREWWVQERKKGFLEEEIMRRPDCKEGSGCTRQKDLAHAKQFNHIITPPDMHTLPAVSNGDSQPLQPEQGPPATPQPASQGLLRSYSDHPRGLLDDTTLSLPPHQEGAHSRFISVIPIEYPIIPLSLDFRDVSSAVSSRNELPGPSSQDQVDALL